MLNKFVGENVLVRVWIQNTTPREVEVVVKAMTASDDGSQHTGSTISVGLAPSVRLPYEFKVPVEIWSRHILTEAVNPATGEVWEHDELLDALSVSIMPNPKISCVLNINLPKQTGVNIKMPIDSLITNTGDIAWAFFLVGDVTREGVSVSHVELPDVYVKQGANMATPFASFTPKTTGLYNIKLTAYKDATRAQQLSSAENSITVV